MTTNIQNALDEKIRKLQQLRDLLSDPEIAKIARSILSHPKATATAVDAGVSIVPPAHTLPAARRTRKKKRGTMTKKIFEIVRMSTGFLTAKQIADAMEHQGFSFDAEEKYVGVSKVLRSLAKKDKIAYKPGEHPKAAIMYTRLPSLVSVQERTH